MCRLAKIRHLNAIISFIARKLAVQTDPNIRALHQKRLDRYREKARALRREIFVEEYRSD